MKGINDKEQIDRIIEKRIKCFGKEYEEAQGHIGENVILSFEHNEQSALVFYELLNKGEIDLEKIDVDKIIYAILSHSTTRVTECPKDIVAQVVRHTDKIEYRNKDFDEMKTYIKPERFKNREYADKTSEERVDEIKRNIVQEAIQKGKIDDNMESLEDLRQLRKDYEETIYFLKNGRRGLLKSENAERNRVIVNKLLKYYYNHLEDMAEKYRSLVTPINIETDEKIYSCYDALKDKEATKLERVVNYILSMDNKKAENQYLKLVKQRIITGEGIEPITQEEIQEIITEQEEERSEKWRARELERTNQPHTKEEMKNVLRLKDAKFMMDLTPEGIKTIEESEKKREEDANLDRLLCEQVERADLARKYNREIVKSELISGIIGKKHNLTEEERRRSAAISAKEYWNRKQGTLEPKKESHDDWTM